MAEEPLAPRPSGCDTALRQTEQVTPLGGPRRDNATLAFLAHVQAETFRAAHV